MYAYLRRQGKSPHDAEDLTPGFLLRLLKKDPLRRVRWEKAKFRSFLLASLQYFLADAHDKQPAPERGGGRAVLSSMAPTSQADGMSPQIPVEKIRDQTGKFGVVWARFRSKRYVAVGEICYHDKC